MLTGAIFAGISALRGPHWLLQQSEQRDIGAALAECLAALPEGQAEKSAEIISKFSAPVALIGAVSAAVMPRIIYEQQHMAKVKAEAMAQKARQAAPAPSQTQVNINVSDIPAPTANPQAAGVTEIDSQLLRTPADGRAVAPTVPTQ